MTALRLPILIASIVAFSGAISPALAAGGQLLPGTHCQVFPPDNVWNTPVDGLPVDPHSSDWLAHMAAGSTDLHPDFGPGGGASPYGFPVQITAPGPRLVKVHFQFASQSDRGRYPLASTTPIEGGKHAGGDRHALMVNPTTCTLYELYHARYRANGRSTAGSGAIWNLGSDQLRPAGWTSADAAGLPILPGLVDYEEVMSGQLDHAIRFTARSIDDQYIWPARHQVGATHSADYPPMGARFRLVASFNLPPSRCGIPCQVVVRALKTYGMILADEGSNWYFSGTADRRWTYRMVDQLKAIPASAFQAVDESCLTVNPNSGAALQPATVAFALSCAG